MPSFIGGSIVTTLLSVDSATGAISIKSKPSATRSQTFDYITVNRAVTSRSQNVLPGGITQFEFDTNWECSYNPNFANTVGSWTGTGATIGGLVGAAGLGPAGAAVATIDGAVTGAVVGIGSGLADFAAFDVSVNSTYQAYCEKVAGKWDFLMTQSNKDVNISVDNSSVAAVVVQKCADTPADGSAPNYWFRTNAVNTAASAFIKNRPDIWIAAQNFNSYVGTKASP